MDLRGYLGVLRRRWLVIVVCILAGVAIAAVVLVRSTPQYQSTARLFVSTPGSDANAAAYQGSLFAQQRVTSYADLIKGSTVAQKVIDKLGLEESATGLVNQITAVAVPDSVILTIIVTDPDPAWAQRLAQATAEVFTGYVSELEGANETSTSPIRANIVDAASLPTMPVSPRPLTTLGLGAILGLLVGLGMAWLRETLDTSITNPEILEDLTGAASLGVIYFDSSAPKRPLLTQLDTRAPRAESFRVLATNLQFLDVDKGCKIFAITSPLAGEGKSTTAINIAIALAEAGKRTLLLEADLRRPRVSEYLGLESIVGLTTVLIGRAELDDVIQPWGDAGLDVVTSGAIPPNPAELLQSKAMKSLLDILRERYDVVIVDCPPMLPVADASLLASQADGAILIVRHGKSTKDQAAQARQRLDSVGAALLGTVLNFVPARAKGYGYGHGYGYGYGYSPKPGAVIDESAWPPVARPVELDETIAADVAPAGDVTESTTAKQAGVSANGNVKADASRPEPPADDPGVDAGISRAAPEPAPPK